VTGVNLGRVAFRQLRNKSGLGSIRLMISGGAALPPGIAEAYNELGLCLMQGYGLTETSPVLTTNTPGHAKHSTVGKAVPGVTLKIDNPNSTGSGEIMAKGDCVMVGYNKNEEATQEAFREGWFATGDYGWLDSEGYLTITGRVKDLIVTGAGKNINPEEVEAELNRSQFIQESLVLGVASKSGVGEDLAALVVPDFEVIDRHAESTGITMTPDKLEQMMRAEVRNQCSQLPDYKRIRKVKLHMEELQRTSTGKLKRFLYREHVLPIPPLE
jgi:long-chain acyl-CoA synthetase